MVKRKTQRERGGFVAIQGHEGKTCGQRRNGRTMWANFGKNLWLRKIFAGEKKKEA